MILVRSFAACAALSISLLAVGCDQVATDELEPTSVQTLSAEEQGLVDFLADHELSTEEVLDVECGLRSDSARNIDRFRRGPDDVYGTEDDREIDSEDTLDSIRQVGPATIDRLYDCAEDLDYMDDEVEDFDDQGDDCDGDC